MRKIKSVKVRKSNPLKKGTIVPNGFDFLIRVNCLKSGYFTAYGVPPQYIKIPLTLYEWLNDEFPEIKGSEKMCGLQICKTLSIKGVEEIEVF